MKRYIVCSKSDAPVGAEQQYNRFKLDYNNAQAALADGDYDLSSCWTSTSQLDALVQQLLDRSSSTGRRVQISCAGFAGALYAIAEASGEHVDVFYGIAPHDGKPVGMPNHVWAVASDGTVWEKWPQSSVEHPTDFDQYIGLVQFTPQRIKSLSQDDADGLTWQAVLDRLNAAGIDTTVHRYEWCAEMFMRDGPEEPINYKFTAPGDWIAHLCMYLPLQKNMKRDAILEFLQDDHPELLGLEDDSDVVSLQDLNEYADSGWAADGDVYTLWIKNLDTGDVVYDNGEDHDIDEADGD